MKILHLDLKPVGDQYAEFRFFWDKPNDCQSRQLPLAEITDLIEKAERDYYTSLPEDYAKTGQALYNWLDGSDRNLQLEIDQHWREGIVIAIAATKKLAHLPWEVLHDGKSFLVERLPAIIPIRWVKNNNSKDKPLALQNQPAERALNVLFMASSPLSIKPELDFEAEEAQVLSATKREPLSLIVEESGCLTELGYLVRDYDEDYFDVIHLTGHATFRDEKPCFITETELGEAEYSSAEDIATELQFQLPKLIFLSGCNTGYLSDAGTVPSMAEALLNQGATAVLSWGQRVLDTDATATAAALYKELSAGRKLAEAVAITYQVLLKNQARDWHLLRLYVTETLLGVLVKRGRKPVPRASVTQEFLDPENRLRVATRENFIGRRRQLQNCLRILKTRSEQIGVLIHGMGGLGKSTIASRLCDRLSRYKKIVLWRQIDEPSLVNKLVDYIENEEQRTRLRNDKEELKYRLRDALNKLNQLVLVFDDFEWNLEPRDGGYILKANVAEVLNALVWAIRNQDNISNHCIIITCRYDFESDSLQYFYKQPLEALRKADLQKKLKQLDAFNSDRIDQQLIERALQLGDGNPRLLEWLNDDVLSAEDADSQLSKFEASSEGWKEKIIWLKEDAPKLKIDSSIEKIVSQCLVFEIPVPRTALEAVCESIPDYKEQLNRAIELGLIEVSPELEESKRVYRVSRIIPNIIPNIKLPLAPQVYFLYQKAHEKLHQLWGNEDNDSKEKWQEIFRLKFADKSNHKRFRQGFSHMLTVQYNKEADKAFRSELRKCTADLVADRLYEALENYLLQKQWREADEETAWIYLLMVTKNGKEHWDDLLQNFPCETLEEINRLWLEKSNNKFGISIQRNIYHSLGVKGNSLGVKGNYDDPKVWDKFGSHVGWQKDGRWLTVKEIYDVCGDTAGATAQSSQLPSKELPVGRLPVLIYAADCNRIIDFIFKFPYEESDKKEISEHLVDILLDRYLSGQIAMGKNKRFLRGGSYNGIKGLLIRLVRNINL